MQVWCDWQLTLCDPHLSALEVRFHDDALYKSMFTLPYLTPTTLPFGISVGIHLFLPEFSLFMQEKKQIFLRLFHMYDVLIVFYTVYIYKPEFILRSVSCCQISLLLVYTDVINGLIQ